MFAVQDPFQRLTAGGTFNRTFQIFAARYDLFLLISGIIAVPLSLMMISMFQAMGSSMHTMVEAMNSLDTTTATSSSQQNLDAAGAYNSNYEDGGGAYNTNYYDEDPYSSASSAAAAGAGTDPVGDALVMNMSKFGSQFVLEYLALLFVAIAGKAAMSYAVAEMYAGRDPSWLDCFKKGLSRWCDLFGAVALVSLGVFAFNFVAELIMIGLASTQNNFAYFLCFLIMVAWVVGLTFVMVSLMILAAVIMVEGKGPINSIKRCWELSWNNRCYIFCTVFCLCMLYYVAQLVLTAILFASGGPDAVFSTGGALLVILPAVIYLPLEVIAETVVYLNIRVQHEGLNHAVLVSELDGETNPAIASKNKESTYALVRKNEEFV